MCTQELVTILADPNDAYVVVKSFILLVTFKEHLMMFQFNDVTKVWQRPVVNKKVQKWKTTFISSLVITLLLFLPCCGCPCQRVSVHLIYEHAVSCICSCL